MQNKMVKRIMVALMCGTIAASSAGVTAFAATNSQVTSGHQNAPIAKYTEYRTVKVVQPENGKIEVTGVYDGYAACDSEITVKLIPDNGYVAQMNDRGRYFTTNNDVDWQGIKEVADGEYSFLMPWCDENTGITIEATFITKEEAAAQEEAQETPAAQEAQEDEFADLVQENDGSRLVSINVAPTEHGKIEVSCTEALTNSVVTVKLIPDDGYVAQLTDKGNFFSTGTYVDWNEIFDGEEEGEYTFSMPWIEENSITISADFVLAE